MEDKDNSGDTLDMEVLENIKAFSGDPQEKTTSETMLSQGMTMQKVQTSYTTAVAVQKPRSIARVVHNVLEEAKLAGASFYYRWEVWDSTKGHKVPIQGASIDLAMCVARNYGNCAIDVESEETLTHYMLKGVLIDLETGFTCPRLFRQRKKQKISGKMESERQEDIVFQIGQSKAIRNAIVQAMPSWLFEKAIATAKQAELDEIKSENIHITRSQVIDFFSKHGVNCDRMEAERGRKVDEWTAQDIVDLRGMATALTEGRISPENLFPELKPETEKVEKKEKPKTKTSPEQPKDKSDSSPESGKNPRQDLKERLEIHFTKKDERDKWFFQKTGGKATINDLTDDQVKGVTGLLVGLMGS
ncbi:MAG TPA: hypothetical protein VMW44_01335 [Candidatus Bathyarchaeia archaeon]|nr:hypothetical protein [Candidatus Bathyarchaeia archaeon]